MSRLLDPEIRKYATPTQAKYFDAVMEHGSGVKAAEVLGVHQAVVNRSMQALKKKAVLEKERERLQFPGYNLDAPLESRPIEAPWRLGKTTIQRTPGGVERVWERFSPDENARMQAIIDYIDQRAQGIEPIDPIPAPKITKADLCNLYPMTDCHVGMLTWGKQTGAPWDLKIAAATLKGCFKEMLDRSPEARVGIVGQFGDWMHVDKVEPFTPASGHILDADIRFPKIVAAALDIFEWLVAESLKKHDEVHVIPAEGNHDPVSSIWMRYFLARVFRDNPRVTINDSEVPYYVYQHGKVMIAVHHGHKKKLAELPLMFASRWPEIWGATTKRYGHSGHMHHEKELRAEYSGMKWRQHPTLAAPDDYSARGGWLSERQASAITYHAEFGQVGEYTVCPEMLAEIKPEE